MSDLLQQLEDFILDRWKNSRDITPEGVYDSILNRIKVLKQQEQKGVYECRYKGKCIKERCLTHPCDEFVLVDETHEQKPVLTDVEIEALAEKEYYKYVSGFIKGYKAALNK